MNFGELIGQAAFSTDNTLRQQAEQQLYHIRGTSPNEFFLQAAEQAVNEQQSSEIRIAAATLIKRGLIPQINETSVWLSLNQSVREQIKQLLVSSLITKNTLVRKNISNALAGVCGVEIPRNQWPEIIPLLVQNINHSEIDVKKAAIQTLGFICEELKSQASSLADDQVEAILTGICLGLKKEESDEEIKCLAVSALHESLQFMEGHFKRKEIRDYVMDLLNNSCLSQNREQRIKSLQCLIDLCKLHYELISEYIPILYNTTSQSLQINDQEIAIPAIEVWNQIANEETEQIFSGKKDSSQCYLIKIYDQLIPVLLINLLQKQQEDELLSIQASSFSCLSLVVEVVAGPAVDIILPFIQSHILSQDTTHKKAAILGLSSLIECPQVEKILQILHAALIPLLNLLNDASLKIRETAGECLVRIAEIRPEVFLNTQTIMTVLPILLQALSQPLTVSLQISQVFNYLSEASGDILDNNLKTLWNMQIEKIVESLIQNAYRSDLGKNYILVEVSFLSIMQVVSHCNNPLFAEKCLNIFIKLFKESTSVFTTEKRQIFQSCQSICIQACILLIKDRLYENQVRDIYVLYTEYMKILNDITPDCIYVISSLASAVESKFSVFIDDSWNYVKQAIDKSNDPEIFKAVLGYFSDVGRSCGPQFSKYLNQIIPYLLNSLNLETIEKETKLNIFLTLGDIAIGCKDNMGQFLPDILQIFKFAFIASIELANNTENKEYSEQLREKLIESFTCFVHGLSNSAYAQQILEFTPQVIEFISQAYQPQLNPTVDFLRNCLGLITDIAKFYGEAASPIIKIPLTEQIVISVKKFSHLPQNKEMLKYAQEVLTRL